jgi:hypothetical membrane protein
MCGIIGPILFTGVVIILGLLRPGYSHVSQAISELGENGAPNAIIQDTNFIIFGLLVIAFAYGLHRAIGYGKGSKVGPILIALFGGVAAIGAGIFPIPNPLHAPVSIFGFITLMVATFIISRRLGQDPRWQGYRKYSLATGVIAVVLFLVLLSNVKGGPWFGALQRLFLADLFIWMEVMAIHLLRISSQTHSLHTP